MKHKEQKEIIERASKDNSLRVQLNSNLYQLDDRWMEFKISGKNIQPRSYHAAAIYKNTFYVQGGYEVDKGMLSDFCSLDLDPNNDSFRWVQLDENHVNYPGKLKSHSCIVYQSKLIFFGGQIHTNENSNLTYIYRILDKQWEKITPNIDLPKLDSHSALLVLDKMYVYGGFVDTKATYSNNVYQFDLNISKWSAYHIPVSSQKIPQARGNFGSVYYNDHIWIFGGTNGNKTINDLWKYNLKNKTWVQIDAKNMPEPRRSHSMIVYKSNFFVFGGIQDVTKQKNDIYIYNEQQNAWSKIQNSSNMIYECSPTLKNKSIEKKKTSNSPKKFENRLLLIPTHNEHQGTDKNEVMKKILEENKLKKFMERKNQLLKEFVEPAGNLPKRNLSPTSQNMMKTLQVIGDQEQSKKIHHQEVVYDSSKKFILGKKPCARDAQSGLLFEDKMLIMGGDRHLMSFSDVYYFDLSKGLQSKKYYDKKP